MSITEDQFRKTLGLFPTGVTVVTAQQHQGQDVGITISSFTSVSLHPPQILFCLSNQSRTLEAFKNSSYFAVNILSAEQSHLSEGFAKRMPINWEDIKTHRHSDTGCLLFSEAIGHVICEKGLFHEAGDHKIIIGKVIDTSTTPHSPPLIRQRGQYLTTQTIPIQTTCKLTHRKTSSY